MMESFVYFVGAVYIAITVDRLTFWVEDII